MVAQPPIPGLILLSLATLFLFLVSLSTPIIDTISFLNANIGGKEVRFGIWGCTGSARHAGYTIDEKAIGLSDNLLNIAPIVSLTKMMVLHVVACVLAFLACICGAAAMSNYSRFHAILMWLTGNLALLFVIIAFSVDMILWNIVAARIRADGSGNQASLGAATWLTLAALILLLLGSCAAGCGSLGDFDDYYYYDDDRSDYSDRDRHRHRHRSSHSRHRDEEREAGEAIVTAGIVEAIKHMMTRDRGHRR